MLRWRIIFLVSLVVAVSYLDRQTLPVAIKAIEQDRLMPTMLFVPTAPLAWAMAFFCVAYFGHQFWSTIVMTLPADLYPKSTVGAIAGLMGCAGGFGGVAFGQLFGWLLDHGPGWMGLFAIAGLLHVVSFGIICGFLPRLTAVNLSPKRADS